MIFAVAIRMQLCESCRSFKRAGRLAFITCNEVEPLSTHGVWNQTVGLVSSGTFQWMITAISRYTDARVRLAASRYVKGTRHQW